MRNLPWSGKVPGELKEGKEETYQPESRGASTVGYQRMTEESRSNCSPIATMGSSHLTATTPKVAVGELVQAVHTFALGLNWNGSDAIILPTNSLEAWLQLKGYSSPAVEQCSINPSSNQSQGDELHEPSLDLKDSATKAYATAAVHGLLETSDPALNTRAECSSRM
ncbi:hypothetical protein llap_8827 [Limosa lapponica baueri]|uniref:Uncharacterized protein n=1 Tax=Limosa lapponica baueri TaxID=1758121 RepID=A0A2I0U478_LIMLA|nr:hypothetical protein llap_8827 [Limosa lapponica baueri]